MKKYLLLLSVTVSLLTGFTGVAHGNPRSSPDEILICDRIQRQGLCEEYRLHSLSAADKQLMTKYCTRGGKSCPDEQRIGRCLKFKDPDGIISVQLPKTVIQNLLSLKRRVSIMAGAFWIINHPA